MVIWRWYGETKIGNKAMQCFAWIRIGRFLVWAVQAIDPCHNDRVVPPPYASGSLLVLRTLIACPGPIGSAWYTTQHAQGITLWCDSCLLLEERTARLEQTHPTSIAKHTFHSRRQWTLRKLLLGSHSSLAGSSRRSGTEIFLEFTRRRKCKQ